MEILKVGVKPEVYVRLVCAQASINDVLTVAEAAKNGPAKVEFYPLPNEPAWTGEGLPPVGTVCEWQANIRHREWVKTTICGHSTDGAYAAFYHDGNMGWSDDCRFRPIRTPEQIAAEERQKAIAEMVDALGCDPESSKTGEFIRCGLLYDAGYRKQVKP